jgi:HD-like signal output (HDOD) protein
LYKAAQSQDCAAFLLLAVDLMYDLQMEKREAYKALVAQVAEGGLAFGTSAQVALKVRQMLDDVNCNVDDLAKLIQADPLLSARVVALANSAYYNRSGRNITEVRKAAAQLSFSSIRSLVIAIVTREMAGKQPNQAAQHLSKRLWEHTTHVASLAQVIARHVTHQDPETAMFAGIVHEIGGFYMLSRVDDFPCLLEGNASDWVDEGEIAVGRAVLNELSVPALVINTIEEFWEGYMAMPPVTLSDTLLLAEELAPVQSPLYQIGENVNDRDMTASVNMAIGEETLARIMEESSAEVSSLIGALQF